MDIQDLQSKIKPTTTIYMSWFLFGSHYASLGKWGTQIIFWMTLGGLGVWAATDLIYMNEIITKHRESVFRQIEELERLENAKTAVKNKINPGKKYRLAMAG